MILAIDFPENGKDVILVTLKYIVICCSSCSDFFQDTGSAS